MPSCRFGFVTFEDVTAERMLHKYDGTDLDGFQITLKFAEQRRGGRGGGGSSDWGCGRDRGQHVYLSVLISYSLCTFS